MKTPSGTLLVILTIAFVAPLATALSPRLRVPALVLEILFGIIVGPDVLDLVRITEPIRLLAEVGLATLIFLAGFEIDPDRIKGEPIRLAATGWGLSVVLGLACGFVLQSLGVIRSEVFVGLALTTTALGALLPILRDAGLLPTRFGLHLLAIGSVGEFGPIIAVALVLSGSSPARSVAALLAFAVLAVVGIVVASRRQPQRLRRAFGSTLRSSGQLYIRLAMVLVGVLAYAASQLGLDVLLGAFTAGVLYRLFVTAGAPPEELEVVESKLEALCMGYLVPIFFVVTGISYDLESLISSPAALLKLPLFLVLLLVVRGVPTLLYRRVFESTRERVALALFSATGLPLIVAIATIGVESGQMRANTAAALVGAGMVSVVLFPMLGKAVLDAGGGVAAAAGDLAGADQA